MGRGGGSDSVRWSDCGSGERGGCQTGKCFGVVVDVSGVRRNEQSSNESVDSADLGEYYFFLFRGRQLD